MPKTQAGVASVERALTILDSFRDGDGLISLEEISRRTKLYKSTILRLLETLEGRDYVVRTGSGKYHVGPKSLRLAKLYQNAIQPADVILPVLRELSRATGESTSYNILRKNLRICVYRVDSPKRIRDNIQAGDILPAYRGASGRIFEAFMKPSGSSTFRRRMVALAVGELDKETAGVAVPVFGPDGKLLGSIAISGPRTRFTRAAVSRMERFLLNAAATVTASLAGDPTDLKAALAAVRRSS